MVNGENGESTRKLEKSPSSNRKGMECQTREFRWWAFTKNSAQLVKNGPSSTPSSRILNLVGTAKNVRNVILLYNNNRKRRSKDLA